MLLQILLFLVFLYVLISVLSPKTPRTIPGPTPWPFVGYLPQYFFHKSRGDLLEQYLGFFQRFGSTFQLRLLNRAVVYLSDLEDLKHFFTSGNYERGPLAHEIMEDVFGDGIFNVDGEQWRVQRQTASSLFHFNNLQSFVSTFTERSNIMVNILSGNASSGEPLDIQRLFMKYTLDSIGQLGFGVPVDALRDNQEALRFAAAFDYVQFKCPTRFNIHPIWKWLPDKEFYDSIHVVDNYMAKIVEERRKEMANGVDLSDRSDLLSRFITAKDDGGKPMFNDKYLLDVLKNFLIAGRDTTAICLAWAIYRLSLHPEVEQKVVDEIAQVIGDGPITYENLKLLKYTKQMIDETLRLHPSVSQSSRFTIKDDTLPSGHVIPKGTRVLYAGWANHRLPQYWTDPLAFNPDRWETDTIKPFQFVAFHGGPRVCLGQAMAYEEIKVALCAILPKFRFRLVDPSSVGYYLSLTMPVKGGLHVYVDKRKK